METSKNLTKNQILLTAAFYNQMHESKKYNHHVSIAG